MSEISTTELFPQRCAAIPDAVAQTLQTTVGALPSHYKGLPVVATGLGSSASAARLLVRLLGERGISASYTPIHRFYCGARMPEPAVLVVFTQGISANARIALQRVAQFAGCILVTSASESGLRAANKHAAADVLLEVERSSGRIVRHPMEDEYTLLPRIIGPVCALVSAIRIADQLSGIDTPTPRLLQDPAQLAAIGPSADSIADWADDLMQPIDFHFTTAASEYAGNLAAKRMECLLLPQPPCRDLFEYAHGPFQTNCASPRRHWVFQSDTPAENALIEQVLPLFPNGLRRIVSPLPAPWDIVYYDLFLNPILLHAIRVKDIDLINWPGKGKDDSAYSIDRPFNSEVN